MKILIILFLFAGFNISAGSSESSKSKIQKPKIKDRWKAQPTPPPSRKKRKCLNNIPPVIGYRIIAEADGDDLQSDSFSRRLTPRRPIAEPDIGCFRLRDCDNIMVISKEGRNRQAATGFYYEGDDYESVYKCREDYEIAYECFMRKRISPPPAKCPKCPKIKCPKTENNCRNNRQGQIIKMQNQRLQQDIRRLYEKMMTIDARIRNKNTSDAQLRKYIRDILIEVDKIHKKPIRRR